MATEFKTGNRVKVRKAASGYVFTGVVQWSLDGQMSVKIDGEHSYSMVDLSTDEVKKL